MSKKASSKKTVAKKTVKKRAVVKKGGISKGDFILVDLTGTVKETDEVFDTTKEGAAKKAGKYKEGEVYRPMLVVVGDGWVLKGLDSMLVGLKVGKPTKITLKPSEAFGERDPEKVEVVPYTRLRIEKIVPKLGMAIKFKGREAIVRSIGGGRVTLDYNPPLAGKALVYDVTLRKVLRDSVEKVLAIIRRWLPTIEEGKFSVDVKKKSVRISVPKEAFYLDGIQIVKRGIYKDIERLFPNIKKVDFVESYVRKS